MSTTSQAAAIAQYEIDPAHSGAQFKVRHMMIANVRGEFSKVSGKVAFDPANPAASSIDVAIDASSLSTREPQRDEHLKSADFLDVAKYPSITFVSKKIVPDGKDAYQVSGDLTIHGVTREVKLLVDAVTPEAKDPWGGARRGATASTTISRKDFGLTWNMALEAGGVLVGEDIHITIEVELVRKG
ncbi:MAG: YceI family protein [Acidobacteriia bacterium]|nr:YceI family protein [Terriglobia bacterium]